VGDIRLKPVTFEQLSNVRHSVFVSDDAGFGTPEFLVIRYEGNYRPGGAGHDDALYIVAAAEAARKAWWAPHTVLDLRELEYTWGDEMEWITSIGWNNATRLQAPIAIVVSDKCRAALKSLLLEAYDRYCFETLEDGFSACRRQKLEWEQAMKKWRDEH